MALEEPSKPFHDHLASIKKFQISLSILEKSEPDIAKRYNLLKKNIPLLEKSLGSIQDWQITHQKTQELVHTLKEEYITLEASIRGKFGFTLDALLKEKGFRLEGQYPSLKTSFYTIKADLENARVTLFYGPEAEKMGECTASTDNVVKTLLTWHHKIAEREFSDDSFFGILFEAYNLALLQTQKKMGDEVAIPELIPLVSFLMQPKKFRQNPKKESFAEYGRIELSYDLARLSQRQQKGRELKLVSAVRGKTRSAYDFLYVPNLRNSSQWEPISGIRFVEVTTK